jgi:hypothetical protein
MDLPGKPAKVAPRVPTKVDNEPPQVIAGPADDDEESFEGLKKDANE